MISRLKLLVLAAAAFVVVSAAYTADVSAGGVVGGGGGAGGCSSCGISTDNGYGWYRFSTSSSGPGSFKDGDVWSSVRQRCVDTGNDSVIAFIIQGSSQTPSSARVYKYVAGDYGTYYDYRGDDGGGWLTYGAANSNYNKIDDSLKVGYSWGSNVAWFCYSDNPIWSVTPSVSINKTSAKPGDLITWTHLLTNAGPAKTSKTINYGRSTGGVVSDQRNLAAGSQKGASGSFTSQQSISQDDVGKSYCRATTAVPSTHTNNNRVTSADACVTVPYSWSIAVTSDVSSVVDSKGKSSVNKSTAEPGGVITWTHTAKVLGPTKTKSLVTYSIVNGSGLPARTEQLGTFAAGSLPDTSDQKTSSVTVTQDNVDQTLCRLTRATPQSEASTSAIDSAPACVTVPYNYTLTPRIVSTSSKAVEEGSELTINLNVDNSGPTKSKSTQWVVSQLTVRPGAGSSIPNKDGGNSAVDPCGTYFTNSFTTCAVIGSGTSVFSTSGAVLSGDILSNITRTVSDLPVGTRLCYSLSVKPASASSANWQHAAPVCVTIGKKPKVQVLGGDLAAGISSSTVSAVAGAITTKKVDGSTKTYGSWVEYGILTSGVISGIASGSAYNGGAATADHCQASLLSFTNTSGAACTDTTKKGSYLTTKKLLDVAAAFPVNASTSIYSGLSDATQRKVVTAKQAITISGGTIAKGDWLVINAPDQTVTISGNINYTTDKLYSIDDVPQLVIIANNIAIDESVTNIDAWLIASGASGIINTCKNYDPAAPLTYKLCDKKLVVNGPTVAKTLYLRRTAGATSGSSAGDPAEVFNLRPDAYLWSVAMASGPTTIQAVYSNELPPRF